METSEGDVIHYGFIDNFIDNLGKKFHIKEIAFDRWEAAQMVQNLDGLGITVVPLEQGFKDMSPPTKRLMELVLERNDAHGGHLILRWMMPLFLLWCVQLGISMANMELLSIGLINDAGMLNGNTVRLGHRRIWTVSDCYSSLFLL